jgi:hypothetical protein
VLSDMVIFFTLTALYEETARSRYYARYAIAVHLLRSVW